MSREITHSRKFGTSFGRGRMRSIGAGLLVSGALIFGACGDGEDDVDDVATTATGAGSTVSTGVQTTTANAPTTAATVMPTGSPASRPTVAQGSDDDVEAITSALEAQFSSRDWYTAVTDVEIDDNELVVTVNEDAAQLTETELQSMCDEVSEVTFSATVGDKIDALRVEDSTGTEIAMATDAGECTVA